MSDAFDQMLADAQHSDSIYRANYGDSIYLKSGEIAATWMARMNDVVDLPESYQFATRMDVKVIQQDDEQDMILYLGDGIFGIESAEGDDKHFILMDAERDAVVLYMEDKNGKCSAQAIPNTFSTVAAIASSQSAEEDASDFSIYKSGKSKKVAGYNCQEYLAADSEYNYEFYMSNEVNVDWRKSFFGVIEKFGNYKTYEDISRLDGMVLESHTYSKKDKKDKTSWITQRIDKTDLKIINGDCEFGALYK